MNTPKLKLVNRSAPGEAKARQTAKAHALLEAFLSASDDARGAAFWAFYRLLDPGLAPVPSRHTGGDTHDA